MPISMDALDFLAENHLQSSRDWYNAHKKRYQAAVLEPLAELVARLAPNMLKIDGQFITEPRVDRTISRIHRDTRFSKDKSLYRDNAWIVFMREKKLYMGLPAFYFELSPSGFSFGMGYYMASTASMASIRQLITNREPSFLEALEAYESQSLFVIDGERYKKTRHPGEPENLRDWLDRKGLSFNHHSADIPLLCSDGLTDFLWDGFARLAPVYHFLCAAEKRRAGAGET